MVSSSVRVRGTSFFLLEELIMTGDENRWEYLHVFTSTEFMWEFVKFRFPCCFYQFILGAESEGRGLVLPFTRGCHEGGGIDRHTESIANRQNTVAQYIATRPLLGLCEGARAREGAKVPMRWWDQADIDWETAKAKGVEQDSTGGSGTDTDGEEEQEDASSASGSSRAEWSKASADEWTWELTRYNMLHRPESSDWVTSALGL